MLTQGTLSRADMNEINKHSRHASFGAASRKAASGGGGRRKRTGERTALRAQMYESRMKDVRVVWG